MFLLGVNAVEENLMTVSGKNILLLWIKAAFHSEGGLWKIFGDKGLRKGQAVT